MNTLSNLTRALYTPGYLLNTQTNLVKSNHSLYNLPGVDPDLGHDPVTL